MTTANTAIGLGSNRGDSVSVIKEAEDRLEEGGFKIIRRSSFYRSKPVDCEPGTPDFINAAVIGLWEKKITRLLQLCKSIERAMGRPANHSSRQARIIDLDILIVGDDTYNDDNLTIPHPQLIERLFVLKPLAEIAPDWIIPSTSQRINEAYDRLLANIPESEEEVKKLNTKN